MRLIHFLRHYPEHSGTARAVQGQARAFARLGHEVEIWTSRSERDPADAAAGVTVCTIGNGGRRFLSAMRKTLRERGRPDVVVLHGQFSPVVVSNALMLRCMKQPYIVCSHGVYHPAMLSRGVLKKRMFGPIERYALRGALAVQLLAADHVGHLENFGVRGRTIIMPNGFDPSFVPSLAAREAGGDGITRALFLGRLDVYTKGLDLLVAAAGRIAAAQKLRLTLMGPHWRDVDTLRAQAARFGDAIEFRAADYIRHPTQIISEYDLLVLPSRHEGFGLSALEAMVAGAPVLASTESGIAEHVSASGGGWLCEPTVDSIATMLKTAVSQRAEWVKMGRLGREYAYANLTWDAIGARGAKAFEELCGAKSRIEPEPPTLRSHRRANDMGAGS